MKKRIKLSLIDVNGKKYTSEEVTKIYFKAEEEGARAILPGSNDLSIKLPISAFYFQEEGTVKTVATSGGFLSFYKNEATFALNTYEFAEEIDKQRVLKQKENAEEILAHKDKYELKDIEKAETSLKKAINRLTLLK